MEKFFVNNKSKGFTLIELLVVIAIIGILASVSISSLSQARERAQVTKVALDIKNLERALFSFNLEYDLGGTWFYETICFECYKFSNLIPNSNFGNYYPTTPVTPFPGEYHYDHDAANSQFTCGDDVSNGTNIFIVGGSYELYERLDDLFADDGTDTCGKVRFRSAFVVPPNDIVIYMIDDNI